MRPDLAALSDEVLITLSNRGLVKRAAPKLLEKGPPTVEWEGDTPRGTWPDGTVTELPPDLPLAETPCSCPARRICKHRIALVLVLREADPPAEEAWDPAGFSEELLLERLGKRLYDQAARLERKGLVVEVLDDGSPTARLPTCTVRFLVRHDLAYAKCDCELPELCAHVALAVRAFRAAPGVPATVELGRRGEVDTSALESLVALSRQVLAEGVVHAPESLGQRFALLRSQLGRQVWPVDLCEDLEDLLAAYRARSARYRPSDAAALLVEPTARLRAIQGEGRTPPGQVLGTSVAPETQLEKMTFVSLGCRVEVFDRQRQAEIYLADPGSGTVLVLRKSWSTRQGEVPPTAPQLANRVVTAGVKLRTLASGQLITQVARRRANRLLLLGSGRQNTSATPQRGNWEKLPAPLRVEALSQLVAHRRARAPRMLRPRLLAEALVVLPVAELLGVRWAAGEQAVVALLALPGGETVELVKRHRAVVPGACAAVAKALQGELRFVAGELVWGRLDPLALVTGEGVVVPELAPSAPVRLEGGALPSSADPLEAAVEQAMGLLAEGAHAGLSAMPGSWSTRLEAASLGLSRLGLGRTGSALSDVATCSSSVRSGGPLEPLIDAWLAARIRVGVAAERL